MGTITPVNLDSHLINQVIINSIQLCCVGMEQAIPPVLNSETLLFGVNGFMDSVGLVSAVVEIERQLEETFGVTILLMDDKAFSTKSSPFRTVGTLEKYVKQRLQKACSGN